MIYFDYNATAPLRNSVKQTIMNLWDQTGNPSSIHKMGKYMRKQIEDARTKFRNLLNLESHNIIWTSSATESNNTILKSYEGPVIISAIEHPSIYNVRTNALICPVNPDGLLDLKALENLLKEQILPPLVCIIAANNETGVIQDLETILEITHRHNGLLFSDCVQALGRVEVPYHKLDGFSFSSHKIGGPMGISALMTKPELKFNPLITGGSQEKYKRAGTINTLGIIGFITALEEALNESWSMVETLRNTIENAITAITPDTLIASTKAKRLPNTSCLSMPNVPSSTQLIHFDLEDFAVSAGSACSSGVVTSSHVLQAMDFPDEVSKSCIRVSLGPQNTKEEAHKFIKSWEVLYRNTKKRRGIYA